MDYDFVCITFSVFKRSGRRWCYHFSRSQRIGWWPAQSETQERILKTRKQGRRDFKLVKSGFEFAAGHAKA